MQLPAKFIESLRGIRGFSEESFLHVHDSSEQVTSVRLNPFKALPVSQLGFLDESKKIPWCENGFYLPKRPSFTLDPLLHAGCYYVQEASSMFLEAIVKNILPDHAQSKFRVLDLCAAPGGKSTHLSGLFPNSLVLANEINKLRASVLRENLIKWGKENTVVTNNDSADFQTLNGFFDLVLVDAPCSGSGLFRKDEDAIKEWSPGNVEMCSKRQKKILEDIWPAIKEGGFLIYSTCSYSREEDEEIMDWLADNYDVSKQTIPVDESWGIVETESESHQAVGYRFFPDRVQGEGFFICCFQKNTPESTPKIKSKKVQAANPSQSGIMKVWFDSTQTFEFILLNEEWHLVSLDWISDISILSQTLYVRKAGIHPGTLTGTEIIPGHELALSTLISGQIPFLQMDLEMALRYLRRETPVLDTSNRGWVLARYEGKNLGWMKVLSNRINNYYPKEWRILKS